MLFKPNTIVGQIIVSCINWLHKPRSTLGNRTQKKTYQRLYLPRLTSRDAAPEGHQVRPELLETFQPSYTSNKGKWESSFLKTMPSEIGYFQWLWQAVHFSTKSAINKLAMNYRRILIAAVKSLPAFKTKQVGSVFFAPWLPGKSNLYKTPTKAFFNFETSDKTKSKYSPQKIRVGSKQFKSRFMWHDQVLFDGASIKPFVIG